MRRVIAALCVFIPWSAQAENLTHITEIFTTQHYTDGEPLSLPPNPELRVTTYELPVGGALPIHKHPYPRYAYVLQGELEIIYTDKKDVRRYPVGTFHAEGPGHWHYGRSVGDVPMKLLVIDHVPPGTKSNTILKTSAR